MLLPTTAPISAKEVTPKSTVSTTTTAKNLGCGHSIANGQHFLGADRRLCNVGNYERRR